ncbi:hypothetical protein JXB22_09595 [candidate division WOR-3 bacterium]|nr:hypothetical protein [candidate division WOR-3 bacterium]
MIILIVLGYAGYQVLRLYLTYGSVTEKVEQAIRVGPTMSDQEVINQLLRDAKENNVQLDPDSIFVDRSVDDSLRIYVAYDDSSDIFGALTIRRHFVVDKIKAIKKM